MKSFHRRTSRPAVIAAEAPPPPRQRVGVRLDALLVEQGLVPSRTAARRVIEAGRVMHDGIPLLKAACELPREARLEVLPDDDDRFVSRGGLKLAGALAASGLSVSGKCCLDVGQSTGGFTDCLLQSGARRVVGVDVGHDQLHSRLRCDLRVIGLEGINCRALNRDDLAGELPRDGFDLIVGDVSFISLTLILPRLPDLLATGGDMLLLVKPQFEVGPQGIGKGGVVRDATLYCEVEAKLRGAAAQCGLTVAGWFDSPITGGDGNREFFIWLNK